jgi:hypothetical protein
LAGSYWHSAAFVPAVDVFCLLDREVQGDAPTVAGGHQLWVVGVKLSFDLLSAAHQLTQSCATPFINMMLSGM